MEEKIKENGLSGTALKRLACLSMLLDHIGASCIYGGLFPDGLMPPRWYWLYRILRWAGRLAFPIYCFLLVEGFLHTRNVKKYMGRMLVFALVSELPFDWAFYRTPFYWGHQNVCFTLLLGLLGMACLRHFSGSDGGRTLLGTALALGCALIAEALQTDYGAVGVGLILVLYMVRSSRKLQCLWGALLVCYELPAPLAFVPVWFYNGQRGRCARWEQWAYYLFYPVHLLVLGCVTNLIL